jgi:diacylglycerol kinase (ATP)
VLWNANAGGKVRGPVGSPTGPDELSEILSAAGVNARVVATESPEQARETVSQAVASGERLIVAAGGDGTVGQIGMQLMGTDVALGIMPLGSVMNIARMLRVPRDLPGAAAVIATRREAVIDVGEANGQIFFETASVGMNAAVFAAAQHFEDGDWGSPLRAIREAFRYVPARMELRLDDRERILTRALMVTVSNAPYTGVGMTVAPDARLNDGKFDVRVFRHFSKFELLRHLASITFGRRSYSPHVATHRAAKVTVVGRRPLPCRADSHDLGTTPLVCRVRAQSLRVLVGPDYVDGRAPDA